MTNLFKKGDYDMKRRISINNYNIAIQGKLTWACGKFGQIKDWGRSMSF